MLEKLKFKILDAKAQVPTRAHDGDAGADLYAVHSAFIAPGKLAKIDIGLAFEIPYGYEGQIRPRSGLTLKEGVICQLGTVDCRFRGSVGAVLLNTTNEAFRVNIGDRIAQIVIARVELVEFEPSQELSETVRGASGFGSTGLVPRTGGNSG